MAKIPLVGSQYTSRSLAASAQSAVNLILELIELAVIPAVGVGTALEGKNKAVLYGAPGRHLFASGLFPSGRVPKGIWSGGGRLFATDGFLLNEVARDGSIINSIGFGDGAYRTAASGWGSGYSDTNPATMWGNGNQLLIISGTNPGVSGFTGIGTGNPDGSFSPCAYIDNGAGPQLCRFTISGSTDDLQDDSCSCDGISGTVNAAAGSTPFVPAMDGLEMTIDGNDYLCTGFLGTAQVVVTPIPPAGTGLAWSAPAGDPVTAVAGAFLDGFFIVQRPEVLYDSTGAPYYARQINISGLNDGTSWDPLDFRLKESYADHIRSILADHELLFIFGTETSECWQDTGDLFPFARIAGAAAHYGALSTYAQVAIAGNVYFLGGDGHGGISAYQIQSFTPTRISTHAIEQQWNKQVAFYTASNPGALPIPFVSYSYLEDGHAFWVINGGFGGQTFCYDVTNGTWTRRAGWTGGLAGSGSYTDYQTQFHTYIQEWGGVHITAGGTASGSSLYQSSVNFYDDNGQNIHWERVLPYQYAAGHQLYMDRLDVDMETGTTLSATVEPTIELDWSDDRGQTFGGHLPNIPLSAGTGLAGNWTKRVYWNQLGGTRGRALRLSQTGQNKVALIDADLQMRTGAH